jgi:hypothetical protein
VRQRERRPGPGRPPFRAYLDRKLGGTTAERWFNFFLRPFAAPSLAQFWRRWNPVYGYVLTYFVYRPARRVLPRRLAVMATFVFGGLVMHDVPAWVVTRRALPPGGTISFVLFGAGVLASDEMHMDLSRQPAWVRVAANGTYVAACIAGMLAIVRRTAR